MNTTKNKKVGGLGVYEIIIPNPLHLLPPYNFYSYIYNSLQFQFIS